MTPEDREKFRAAFAGIVQGNCERCGECDDDECACDRITEKLLSSMELINEEADEAKLAAAVERGIPADPWSGFSELDRD